MSASIKSFLVMLCLLPLILFISSQVSEDDYAVPVIFMLLVLGFAFKQFVAGSVRLHGFLLSVLAFGYIVGNRGFAALGPAANSPVFVGELTMVFCLLYMVSQFIIQRESIIPPFPLAKILLAFLMYAAIRLAFDVRTFGLVAIRDSAMVYYALFFFIAYQVSRDGTSRAFFQRTLFWAFAFLVPTGLISRFAPSWYEPLSVRGIPIIFQKGDLVCIFCAVGAIMFYCFNYQPKRRLPSFITVALIGVMLLLGARAGLVALLVPMGFLFIARLNRLIVYLTALIAVAAIGTVIYVQVMDAQANSLEVYNLYEKYLATIDTSNQFDYQTEMAGRTSADNNQFRFVWWKTVINDTIEYSPWVGLGFGYDLTEHFAQSYFGSSNTEILETRSPHSYVVGAFGRLGVVGLLFALTIFYFLLRGSYHSAMAIRHGDGDRRRLAMWLSALAIFTGGLFGVVLEGPMGGVMFWSLLGMACSYDEDARQESRDRASLEIEPIRVQPARAEQPVPVHRRLREIS